MSNNTKKITIYDKNGNPLEIKEHLKGSFLGKGYFMAPPVKKEEKTSQEENK